MLFCDVGNTSFTFFDGQKITKKLAKYFDPTNISQDVYYICVNPLIKNTLRELKNWIDLSSLIDMQKYYPTMGIDRIMACEAIENGIIIDAGSAITVDVVKNGIFEGGFIYVGTKAMQKAYKNISSQLDYSFNFEVNLDKMPKNTQDAISYGYLKTLYSEVISYNMNIILTGGDAMYLSKVFKNATVDELLIFKGMLKFIKRVDRC